MMQQKIFGKNPMPIKIVVWVTDQPNFSWKGPAICIGQNRSGYCKATMQMMVNRKTHDFRGIFQSIGYEFIYEFVWESESVYEHKRGLTVMEFKFMEFQ
jgi:hypothetical protein